MMIALPNQDASWTVTLFMPHDKFEALTTPEKLLAFFKTHYPDAIPLIGKDRLVKDFFATKPSGLICVKVGSFDQINFVQFPEILLTLLIIW